MSAPAAARSVVVDDATASALGSLRTLRSVDEIVDAAPQVLTRMGFERVIFSDVSDGVWTPLEIHIPRDAPWALDILEAGRSAPQDLSPTLIETDMIKQRRPYIVSQVQDNPRVNRPIAAASKSSAYLAAPVVVGDEVGVLLHVDRYFGGASFSGFEATQLAVFAEALGMAIERAQLTERLARVAADLGSLTMGISGFSTREPAAPTKPASPLADLTPREQEVADLVAEGYTNGRIAAELFLSEATVKSHVKHILRKVGASHRAEAVAKLLRS